MKKLTSEFYDNETGRYFAPFTDRDRNYIERCFVHEYKINRKCTHEWSKCEYSAGINYSFDDVAGGNSQGPVSAYESFCILEYCVICGKAKVSHEARDIPV